MFKTIAGRLRSTYVRIRRNQNKVKRYKNDIKVAKRILQDNPRLYGPVNNNYINEVQSYWEKHYGRRIDSTWHVVFSKVTGNEDVRFIPSYVWLIDILPFFNNLSMRPTYKDKNLFDLFLDQPNMPKTIIKRIHGRYYNSNNILVENVEAEELIRNSQLEMIIKPSQSNNGYMINFVKTANKNILLNGKAIKFSDLETLYGQNFIIQDKIKQHNTLSQVHPCSVNTIRVRTFRWHNTIYNLPAYARFGINGSLTDNMGTGGIGCGIDDYGVLDSSGVDVKGRIYYKHPTTGFDFDCKLTIPSYNLICKDALKMHSKIPHFDIVSWDYTLNEHAEPIVLEMNFLGVSYVYQFATRKPFFGDFTEAVLDLVRRSQFNERLPS